MVAKMTQEALNERWKTREDERLMQMYEKRMTKEKTNSLLVSPKENTEEEV